MILPQRFFFEVPSTTALVLVVVEDQPPDNCEHGNLTKARNDLTAIFGPNPHIFEALCSRNTDRGIFGLFLPTHADLRRVSHEVFHLTLRMLEWHKGKPFKNAMHEEGAYLHEFLMDKVWHALYPPAILPPF